MTWLPSNPPLQRDAGRQAGGVPLDMNLNQCEAVDESLS